MDLYTKIKSVDNDRKEFIETINSSEITQEESDTLLGILDNVIATYEAERKE